MSSNKNQPSPAVVATNVQTKNFTVPTNLPQQYNAREHRANAKEQRAEEQRQITNEAFRREAVKFGAACNLGSSGAQASNSLASVRGSTLLQSANQRLDQVRARDELYAQVQSPKETQPQVPLQLAPSSQRVETVNARPDTMTRRAINQVDAQVELDKKFNGKAANAAGAALLREAAKRNNTPGVSSVQSEKAFFEQEYRKGNEEAYAYVDALTKSVRGYTDTSEQTLLQVKEWNEREAARRGVAFQPKSQQPKKHQQASFYDE